MLKHEGAALERLGKKKAESDSRFSSEKVYTDTMVSIKTGPCTLTLTLRNFKIEHQYDIYLYLETSLYVKVRLLY